MNRLRSLRGTRPLQVGFLVLLAVCSAQLAYWMFDEVRYTAAVQQRLRTVAESDVESARAMLRFGARWDEVSHRYPSVARGADPVTLSISPALLAQLDAARFHRLNRYAWEGAFFLAVLLAAMAVVSRAVKEQADLRQRQDDFLAAMSHELKSPLASMRLSVETLALRDPPPARRAELVTRLLTDLDRLQRMIENVLTASRLSSGETRHAPERLLLAEAVADVTTEMESHGAEAGVALRVDVAATLEIVADPEAVQTALRNLLHNALRASPNGATVTVTGTLHDGFARLRIADNGIGFPPGEAKRLFQKFYRITGGDRGRSHSTGLGLYLARKCVELDCGTVAAESAGPGRGACFTLSWPAARGLAS